MHARQQVGNSLHAKGRGSCAFREPLPMKYNSAGWRAHSCERSCSGGPGGHGRMQCSRTNVHCLGSRKGAAPRRSGCGGCGGLGCERCDYSLQTWSSILHNKINRTRREPGHAKHTSVLLVTLACRLHSLEGHIMVLHAFKLCFKVEWCHVAAKKRSNGSPQMWRGFEPKTAWIIF